MKTDIIKYINNLFENQTDFIHREIDIDGFSLHLFFLESVASGDKVNGILLRLNPKTLKSKKALEKLIPVANVSKLKDLQAIEYYLSNGFTIIYASKTKELLAIETKAELDRGVQTPDSEPAVIGPKDAFTENFQKNIGLIKRRLKTKSIIQKDLIIGKRTNTLVSLIYLSDVADNNIVDKVYKKLEKIETDGIIDSGYIVQFLSDEAAKFPTINMSERPDVIVSSLLEGKIAIVIDTSPFVLIIPSFLVDFLSPPVDNYNFSKNVNFIKTLRIICFILSIMTPALYIALTNYNQESIPTTLLLNYSSQRSLIPYPAIIEAILMLIICEILRESDARFPSSHGSAMSLLGGLIIGEAAVRAGLISPVMIIIIAITFLTSLIFTNLEIQNSLRTFRIIFLFSASLFGLYGFLLALVYLFIEISNLSSFGKSFSYPLAPFDKTYFNKTIFRTKRINDSKRSNYLVKKDTTKQRSNS